MVKYLVGIRTGLPSPEWEQERPRGQLPKTMMGKMRFKAQETGKKAGINKGEKSQMIFRSTCRLIRVSRKRQRVSRRTVSATPDYLWSPEGASRCVMAGKIKTASKSKAGSQNKIQGLNM